jgi:hypothetical protein
LRIEAITPSAAELDVSGTARRPSATSHEDGSFELLSADANSALAVHSSVFAVIADRRIAQFDGSIGSILVLAHTAPVAGRVIGSAPGQRVRLRASHTLPLIARGAENEREVEFVIEVEIQTDGSFDFGRVPCSAATVLECEDAQGTTQRTTVPIEGTLNASIDCGV